jgi:hypothetical protein
MENQEQKNDGKIKVFIAFKTKEKPFLADPQKNLRVTIDNIRKIAKENPEKYWNLPEMNNGGQRIVYRLGRISNGKSELFQPTKNKGEEQCLADYNVKEGDKLILVQKVIAG